MERRSQFASSIPTEHESLFVLLHGFPHPKHLGIDVQAAGKYDLVDARAAAFLHIR